MAQLKRELEATAAVAHKPKGGKRTVATERARVNYLQRGAMGLLSTMDLHVDPKKLRSQLLAAKTPVSESATNLIKKSTSLLSSEDAKKRKSPAPARAASQRDVDDADDDADADDEHGERKSKRSRKAPARKTNDDDEIVDNDGDGDDSGDDDDNSASNSHNEQSVDTSNPEVRAMHNAQRKSTI